MGVGRNSYTLGERQPPEAFFLRNHLESPPAGYPRLSGLGISSQPLGSRKGPNLEPSEQALQFIGFSIARA